MRKTLINALCLMIAVLSGICLFVLKYQVKEEERQLQTIHREILQNKREIHMLEAEWAHLNDPQRLLELVHSQTDWETISAPQISTLSDIPLRPEVFPAAPEVIATEEEKTETVLEKPVIQEVVQLKSAMIQQSSAADKKHSDKGKTKVREDKKSEPVKPLNTVSAPKGTVSGGVWKPLKKQATVKSISVKETKKTASSQKTAKPAQPQKSESMALQKGKAALSSLLHTREKR